eukprot:278041_1
MTHKFSTLERMGSYSKVFEPEPDCSIVYEGWIDKRGELNTSWKNRYAVLFENCELFYYEANEDDIDRKTPKGVIHLLKIQDIRPNDDKGKSANGWGWEIQHKKRTYKLASPDEEERDLWIKLIQDTRDVIVFETILIDRQNKNTVKPNKDHAYESKINVNAKPKKHQKTNSMTNLLSFLTQSNTDVAGQSIDGLLEDEENDEKEMIQYPMYEHELTKYKKLDLISLSALRHVATLKAEKGCYGFQYRNAFEKKQRDLIVSNQFLQIGIGPSLTNTDDEEMDEKENKDNGLDLKADVRHSGELRTTIEFIPNTDSFTICCFLYLMKYDAGNRIISNKYKSRQGSEGFEFMMSPNGKVSAFLCGYGKHAFIEIGSSALELFKWYYVTIVVNKTSNQNDDDEKEGTPCEESTQTKGGRESDDHIGTDIYVYLNGELDGKLSFGKVTDFNVNKTDHKCVVGSSIDLRLKRSLCGKIYKMNIYQKQTLNKDQIATLFATEAKPGQTVTFSYIPSSLRVEIPHCKWQYHGRLYGSLPECCHIEPRINDSFTITAWVVCTGPCEDDYLGSVILSNLKSINSNEIIQKQGFEILYPTKGSNVLSVMFTSMNSARAGRDSLSVQIGRTKCELNKAHSIAVTVKRLENGNTVIAAYINGKQDGSYQTRSMDLSGRFCTFFGRNGDEYNNGQFHGAIQNLRYFDRALTEGEIASIYVCDQQERFFTPDQTVLYHDDTKNTTAMGFDDDEKQSKSYTKGLISRYNHNESEVFIKCASNDTDEICMNLSEIEILNKDMVTILDLNALKQNENVKEVPNNLGGMIYGSDFKGIKFKMFLTDGNVLQHLLSPSYFTLLQNIEPFPIEEVQELIENQHVPMNVLLNRLLSIVYILLRDINVDNRYWDYLHQYILVLDDVWSHSNNFSKLKAMAKSFQATYLQQQFDLFDALKAQKHWKAFDIENNDYKHENIICRQDAFQGGLQCELDDTVVSNEISKEYDQKVATMLLWGRNYVINTQFHKAVASLYSNDYRFEFHAGACKTYERMMEKTIEYHDQGCDVKYPTAFEICDISRCSVSCCDLDAVYDALQILKETLTIIRIENRFSTHFDSAETYGYRNMVANVLFADAQTNLKSICEVQFHLKQFLMIKKNLHKYDKIIRASSCKALLRNYNHERMISK